MTKAKPKVGDTVYLFIQEKLTRGEIIYFGPPQKDWRLPTDQNYYLIETEKGPAVTGEREFNFMYVSK